MTSIWMLRRHLDLPLHKRQRYTFASSDNEVVLSHLRATKTLLKSSLWVIARTAINAGIVYLVI
jgi:hypothetical protein